MSVSCPNCGHTRWELVRLEHRMLHVDVDLSGDTAVVESNVVPTMTSAVVGATCDICGHEADPAVTGLVAKAALEADTHR